MKLKQHEKSGALTQNTARYVYDIFREDGSRVCQCGSEADAQLMVNIHPNENRTIVPVPLPSPPQVVNVSFTEGEKEKQLNSQNVLPETTQEPLTL